jgi:hypothetical protein
MVAEIEGCPVPEELIGRLYLSSIQEVDKLVSQLPPGPRGSLATFCYNRAHLRDIGLAIAATCDLETLVDAGGRAGTNLFEVSRERPSEPKQPYSWMRRAQISLAATASP